MKHRISPATAISLVALFFSLTGAGFAASRYLITSVSQIKPSVRHALREQRGSRGPAGPQGPTGTAAKNSIVGTALWFAPPGASVAESDPNNGNMTTSQPATSAVADCPSGSYALEGGYTGNNEIVTTSVPNALAGAAPPSAWTVDARLIPGESSGWVIAWAICVPLLPPS